MRGAFVRTLVELAERDTRIVFLTGDLGYTVVESFAEKFPNRFLNVGVAEQNMVGLATGLAEAGFIPFVYSIVPFASLRPYEFIRNGPILHQFRVRIVAVGGGFEYGSAGATHHGLEDIGVMRVQPGISVIAPVDYEQARTALLKTWDLPGPIYYRFGKNDETTIPGLGGRFELGCAQLIREGEDILFITTGSIAKEVVSATNELATHGISCAVLIVASLSPAPVGDLCGILARFPIVITVEAHYMVGGVGSLVSEVIAEHGIQSRVIQCGVKSLLDGVSGSEDCLNHAHGLSSELLTTKALQVWHEIKEKKE